MEVDIIITIAIAVLLIFTIGQVARTIRSGATHKTLRKAIEQGQPLTPELIDRLERAPEPTAADQRIGFVLVALSLAMFATALINRGDNNWVQLSTIALFPLFVGGALLLRLRLAARSRDER